MKTGVIVIVAVAAGGVLLYLISRNGAASGAGGLSTLILGDGSGGASDTPTSPHKHRKAIHRRRLRHK